jgi:phosphatidylinositol glycan class O
MAFLSIGSITLILIKVLSTGKQSKTSIAIGFLSASSSLLLFVYSASLFSNSYVVNEDSVSSFFSQSLLLLHGWELARALLRRESKAGRTQSRRKVLFDFFRHLTSPTALLVMILSLAAGCLRLSHVFFACREEQRDCITPSLLRSLSVLAEVTASQRNLRYFISVVVVIAIPVFWQKWMRHHGNLTGFAPGVLWVSYGLPLSAVCLCLYWALQALPPGLHPSPQQMVALPRVLYALSALCLVIFLLKPLCILLAPQTTPEDGLRYSNQNLIPRVYNHIRLHWRRHLRPLPTSSPEEKPPVVYGLATVYSSSLLLLISSVLPMIYMLLGDGLAPSLTLFLAVLFIVLELNAVSTCNNREKGLIVFSLC